MQVPAQDFIILERGDTLHVDVREISEEQIHFNRPGQDAVYFSAGTNFHLLPPETNDFSPFIGFQMNLEKN